VYVLLFLLKQYVGLLFFLPLKSLEYTCFSIGDIKKNSLIITVNSSYQMFKKRNGFRIFLLLIKIAYCD